MRLAYTYEYVSQQQWFWEFISTDLPFYTINQEWN